MWVPKLVTSTITCWAISEAQRRDLLLNLEFTHWLRWLTDELETCLSPPHPSAGATDCHCAPAFTLVLGMHSRILALPTEPSPQSHKGKILTMTLVVTKSHLNDYKNQLWQNNAVFHEHVYTAARLIISEHCSNLQIRLEIMSARLILDSQSTI